MSGINTTIRGTWPDVIRILTRQAGAVISALLLLLTISSAAQSSDRNSPTPLSVDELTGDFEQNNPESFYSFMVGPGQVTFTLDVKARGYGGALTVTLSDTNGRELGAFDKLAGKGQSEKVVRQVSFGKRQTVVMRIYSGNGQGSYRLRISGAAELSRAERTAVPSASDATGPSTERDHPTPLTAAGLNGDFHQDDPAYFYSFNAGPGEVVFTLDLKARGYGGALWFTLFDEDGRELGAFDKLVGQGASEKLVKRETFGKRQTVVMRVHSGNGEGSYQLRVSGAVEFAPAQSSSAMTEPEKPVEKPGPRPSQVDTIGTEKRIALVIGNSDYRAAPLRNPVNDARDMTRTLNEYGFEVIASANVTKKEMEDQIRAFGQKLKSGGIGLFYFSGHGIQVNGQNYLLPVGANIEKEQDVEYEAVEAGRVLGEMEAAGSRLNIVILDACRNNPFARSFRTATRGLAVMNAPSGTVIAYSTAPGSIASDGDTANGLYTQELLSSMRLPGLKIEDVLKRVRIAVREKSSGKQVPWESSSLDGDFYFVRK